MDIFEESDSTYGSPRMIKELKARGWGVGMNRVANMMRAADLRARKPKRFKVTTDSKHNYPVSPNVLDQKFRATRPGQIWVSDIRYVRTKSGTRIISTNVRARKPDGCCYNLLYQAYLTYSKLPHKSVFLLLIITDISKYLKNNRGFHYYTGEDRSLFRFPDNELLKTGIIYTHTEFEILQLIEQGLSSKEIANKLFRSPYTISTHRTNILKKSGKSSIIDVIHDLKEMGLL